MLRFRAYAFIGAALVLCGYAGIDLSRPDDAIVLPETVRLPGGSQSYRPAGEFRRGTWIVDAPFETVRATPIEVMKYQVSEADYALCVAAAACPETLSDGRADRPQTNVSFKDAAAYALWLSDQTGLEWRLPTDAEWLRAAGERAFDEGFPSDANGADPSRRWISTYRREVERRGAADLERHALGHFGENALGLADMAGNVWEWTETCFQNGTVSPDGLSVASRSDYCGVRAVQGKHRGFVIDFVRNARSGGCAAGVPPDYLGFRLVRPLL